MPRLTSFARAGRLAWRSPADLTAGEAEALAFPRPEQIAALSAGITSHGVNRALLRAHRGWIALYVAIGLVGVALGPVVPALVAAVTDHLRAGTVTGRLVTLTIGAVALAAVVRWLGTWIVRGLVYQMTHALKLAVFARLQRVRPQWLTGAGRSPSTYLMTSPMQLAQLAFVAQFLVNTLLILVLLGYLVVVFGLTGIVVTVLTGLIVYGWQHLTGRQSGLLHGYTEHGHRRIALVDTVTRHWQPIGRQQWEGPVLRAAEQARAGQFAALRSTARSGAVLGAVAGGVIPFICLAALVTFGLLGDQRLGSGLALLLVVQLLVLAIRENIQTYGSVAWAASMAADVETLFRAAPLSEPAPLPGSEPGAVRFGAVTLAPGARAVLLGADDDVRRTLDALTGATGPAPPTAAVAGTLTTVTRGEPELDGSIAANITLWTRPDPARYAEAVDRAGLGAVLATRAGGSDAALTTGQRRLSDGEAARVSLARALYQSPDVLVLDDVLSALDPATATKVAAGVFGPDAGPTRIYAGTRADPAAWAGHIVLCGPGEPVVITRAEATEVALAAVLSAAEAGRWSAALRTPGASETSRAAVADPAPVGAEASPPPSPALTNIADKQPPGTDLVDVGDKSPPRPALMDVADMPPPRAALADVAYTPPPGHVIADVDSPPPGAVLAGIADPASPGAVLAGVSVETDVAAARLRDAAAHLAGLYSGPVLVLLSLTVAALVVIDLATAGALGRATVSVPAVALLAVAGAAFSGLDRVVVELAPLTATRALHQRILGRILRRGLPAGSATAAGRFTEDFTTVELYSPTILLGGVQAVVATVVSIAAMALAAPGVLVGVAVLITLAALRYPKLRRGSVRGRALLAATRGPARTFSGAVIGARSFALSSGLRPALARRYRDLIAVEHVAIYASHGARMTIIAAVETAGVALFAATVAAAALAPAGLTALIAVAVYASYAIGQQFAALVEAHTEVDSTAQVLGRVSNLLEERTLPRHRDLRRGPSTAAEMLAWIAPPDPSAPAPGHGLLAEDLVTAAGVEPVSVKVGDGQLAVVRGGSGAGKSVLLRTLAGFSPIAAGTVLVAGRPPAPYEQGGRAALRLVENDPPPLPIPLTDACPPAAASLATRWSAALAISPAGPHSHLDGLEPAQRQILALATACVADPRVLLIDETTSSLDPARERLLLGLIREHLPRAAIVAVLHRPDNLDLADIEITVRPNQN